MFQVVVVVVRGKTGVAVLAMAVSFFNIDYVYIDIDIYDVEYNSWIHIFMEDRKKLPEALHAWLIILKAWRSMSRYLLPTLFYDGYGESDFRVFLVLLD